MALGCIEAFAPTGKGQANTCQMNKEAGKIHMKHRNPNYNVQQEAIQAFSREEQLAVYRQMARARKFEDDIVAIVKSGKKFNIKVHMSSGQEAVAAALSVAARDYQYFTQHRSMDLYIAMGAPVASIRDEMLCLDTGCARGNIGGSFNYFTPDLMMYGHTGFIGENVSVGVGAALGSGKKTACVFGDGAAEEDYVLEAFGFAATHNLPVLFVCNDNGLSVLSPLQKRRSWDVSEVAESFGLQVLDTADDPFTLMSFIRSMDCTRPALVNCHVNRIYWHAGTGVDGPPDWDRYQIVRKQLSELGYEGELKKIEEEAEKEMKLVWKEYL